MFAFVLGTRLGSSSSHCAFHFYNNVDGILNICIGVGSNGNGCGTATNSANNACSGYGYNTLITGLVVQCGVGGVFREESGCDGSRVCSVLATQYKHIVGDGCIDGLQLGCLNVNVKGVFTGIIVQRIYNDCCSAYLNGGKRNFAGLHIKYELCQGLVANFLSLDGNGLVFSTGGGYYVFKRVIFILVKVQNNTVGVIGNFNILYAYGNLVCNRIGCGKQDDHNNDRNNKQK